MYKNFWYACGQSESVTRKPRKLKILGQTLVAYRTEAGKAVVMSDICIHRGGSLSSGTLEGDFLRCPYHGWKYGKDGACKEIPSNGANKTVSPRARVDAYPTEDKYGFTWVFLGDLPAEQRPPIPDFPGWDTETFRPVYGEFTWNANYRRVVENSLDPAHAAWVHKSSFGSNSNPEVPAYTVTTTEWGASTEMTLLSPKLKGLWGRKREVINEVGLYTGFSMPNLTYIHMTLANGKMRNRLYNIAVPVDEETTITHWVILRDFFKSPFFDRDAHRRTMKIFYEDGPVVASQRPELIPEQISAELHVKCDAIQIAYRKQCQVIEENGWGIDMDRYRTLEGKKATMIPCPRRRQDDKGAWVFPEVAMSRPSQPAGPTAN
ncbi:MAG: vanillate demethylase oxygenase subunit [Rickettsiales bacterium]|nr:vanillate demethylase oxygenase subunit [Rickettsiales bacterium]|tara:strand:+ start:587 stop:1717 length:1131 start_codon:yes stop_codon:yes gene_type:complete